jgi:hypothetical protein
MPRGDAFGDVATLRRAWIELWATLRSVLLYHRGQATTMMRQLRASPPARMDLITFYRERRS